MAGLSPSGAPFERGLDQLAALRSLVEARAEDAGTALASPDAIRVRGAREHNLRSVDVTIPRDRFVVITGPSGSGKSSLAFDTIYAEGQRRYVESLSAYARQFLDQISKPEVDAIDGLSPAISIEQKSVGRSPRSTVGTITELADYLRLLYARAGDAHCWKCDALISSQSIEQMVDRVMILPEGARVQLMAPVVRGRKGIYRKELDGFRAKGFVRARIDGEMRDLADEIKLAKTKRHDIDVVVDRIVVRDNVRGRLADSIATALELADDLLIVDVLARPAEGDAPAIEAQEWMLSQRGACVTCDISYPEISPRLFSFNNPFGACDTCGGLGAIERFELARIVPDETLSIADGAIAPWQAAPSKAARAYYAQILDTLADHYGFDLEKPWARLSKKLRNAILEGDPDFEIEVKTRLPGTKKRRRNPTLVRTWDGVVGDLDRRVAAGGRSAAGLARFRGSRPCPDCEGTRLRIEARHVRVGGESLPSLYAMSVERLASFIDGLALDAARRVIAERVLGEIRDRLRFLCQVGLGYLSLDRAAATLSGGEAQRIRLATQIGSQLLGVLYILDEPSIGLHPADNEKLLDSLERLRDIGNSVLVVEHDEATMRRADYIIDMGPGAGVHGGEIVAEGPPAVLMEMEASTTGAYLAGRRAIPVPAARREPGRGAIVLEGCREHNLKNVDLEIPIGLFSVVTGVSGSGKSTLINDTLHRVLAEKIHGAMARPGEYDRCLGIELIDKVIDVDQAPIGRSPRSNPATYSGAFGPIRELFTRVPEARMRGYGSGRFSFNVKGGRCESCEGDGALRLEMNFLPDVFVPCQVCGGRRYNRETLAITYAGKTIADVLDMTVEEALAFMENVPPVRRPLQALADVGLGYLQLGQSAVTLSGGEAQRIKLAKELAKRSTGRTLYLLDEPTTGLHFQDVENLLQLIDRLVELGNTVVVIEHHLDVIKTADHVIDLGPAGGERGGEIVAKGTPEAVARVRASKTGQALREVLGA